MDSQSAFCTICGQLLAENTSICRRCQLQQKTQKQKVWLASGVIGLFILMLTTLFSLALIEDAQRKESERLRVESNRQIERLNQAVEQLGASQRRKNKAERLKRRMQRGSSRSVPEPDFGPYIADLQRRIRHHWQPPRFEENKRIVVIFYIQRDGQLMNLYIQQSSGSHEADQAALDAVRATAPFPPLPSNYRGTSVPVQFTFDYELSKHYRKKQSS